jgi:hypothetical protein
MQKTRRKKFFQPFTRIQKYWKRSVIVFLWGVTLLGGLDTYYGWRNKLFNKDDDVKVLQNIGVSKTIDYYQELLGNPVFLNKNIFIWYSEYIFEKEKFYVQAVVDENNIVQLYSITAKEPITIKWILWEIKLCKLSFDEINIWLWYEGKGWYLSNRNFEYFEIFWWDGSVWYKEYVFAYNSVSDCANFNMDDFDYRWWREMVANTYSWPISYGKEYEIIDKNYRKNSKFNTYGEASFQYSLYEHNKYLDYWPYYGQIMFAIEPPKFWWNFI